MKYGFATKYSKFHGQHTRKTKPFENYGKKNDTKNDKRKLDISKTLLKEILYEMSRLLPPQWEIKVGKRGIIVDIREWTWIIYIDGLVFVLQEL